MRLRENRTETVFTDFKASFSHAAALAEAQRCLYCFEPPCVGHCPTRIDVPGFIRKITTGNLKGAARSIYADNVLSMSCARVCPTEVLCAGHCVLPAAGIPAIQIGRLQRYVADLALENRWNLHERAPSTGFKVALVGAGPASLACAYELARLGHACTLIEKRNLPGGLNTMGIAPYKLKADRALEEAEWVLSMGGIDVVYGEEVGFDASVEDLERDYDAIFLGIGLGEDKWLYRLPNHDMHGIRGATEFIEEMKLGQVSLQGITDAVVIGGGNTAVDAVRELVTLGVRNVSLVYRRTAAQMPGYAHEWAVAVQQGVQAWWHTVPVGFEGNDSVTSVRCIKVDADLKPTSEAPFFIPANLVLLAIGQSGVGDIMRALPGIVVKDGVILVDEQGRTGRPKWYAGGDCVNGGKEVVNAVGEGKRAARAIHAQLTQAHR